ncbi:helix-turn-helix transcriptional regulator [Shewanella frigidimarina]|uniref:helix-turn-helix transcriptional regulator n=1 Tax=Shewanella frigidimarina TaxID=56812 RepID=UPI003D791E62
MLPTFKIINSLRLAGGLSVAKLATKMGRSRQTIYNWEDGTSEPNLSEFLHLCMIVGLSTSNLFPQLTTLTEEKDEESESKSTSSANNS